MDGEGGDTGDGKGGGDPRNMNVEKVGASFEM